MKTVKILVPILVILAVAAVVGYYHYLPDYWKAPTLTAEVPASAKLGDDINVTVTVHSEHPNVKILKVMFFPEGYFSSSVKTGNLVYPIVLKEIDPKDEELKGFLNIIRKTRPVEWTYKYDVPLGEVYYEGKLVPGTLKGRIDAVVDYPDVSAGRVSGVGYPAVRETISCPFKIELLAR